MSGQMHHELKMAAIELGSRVAGLVVEHRGHRVALTYHEGRPEPWSGLIDVTDGVPDGAILSTAIGNGRTFLTALDAAVTDAEDLGRRAQAEATRAQRTRKPRGKKPPPPAAIEPGPEVHRDDGNNAPSNGSTAADPGPEVPSDDGKARGRPRRPPARMSAVSALVGAGPGTPDRITLDALFTATAARDPGAIADALSEIFTPGLRGAVVDLPIERAPELLAALATAASLCPERQAEVVYLLEPLASAWRSRLFRLELTVGGES